MRKVCKNANCGNTGTLEHSFCPFCGHAGTVATSVSDLLPVVRTGEVRATLKRKMSAVEMAPIKRSGVHVVPVVWMPETFAGLVRDPLAFRDEDAHHPFDVALLASELQWFRATFTDEIAALALAYPLGVSCMWWIVTHE